MKTALQILLAVLISVLIQPHIHAQSFYTKQAGDWADTATWYNGILPGLTDSIYINHNLTYHQDIYFQAGAYVRIDTLVKVCGFNKLTFVCGADLYNYGTLKVADLEWTGPINHGKIHILTHLLEHSCVTSHFSGIITVGIPYQCDGCSVPIFNVGTTPSKEIPTGAAKVYIYDPFNENINYSYSLDSVDFQHSKYFNDLAAGTYNIYIKGDSNCILKDQFEIKLLESNEILIYPNPIQNQFTIELYNQLDNYIQLFDDQGKLIYEDVLLGNQTYTISALSEYSAGMYILDVSNEYGRERYKLVKK